MIRLIRTATTPGSVQRVNKENPQVHTILQDSPEGRPAEKRPSPDAKVVGLPRVGGLHRRYEWKEAA